MADVVGTIKVNATLDSAKFEAATGNLEKTTKSKFKSMASDAEGSFKSAMATVAKVVTATAATIGTLAVKSYADYEQLTGGVKKLFDDAYDTVIENAEKAYKTAGLSANEYMETVTSFSASLISGLGGDTKKAAKIADKAISDMADNANTFGTSIELIQNAYQGFAKQNYTMLDNLKLGYGGTASEMARLVNESGVLGDTFTATADNINSVSFATIIEAIHAVQEEMNITGTTANEADGTISGSFDSMKAAAENFFTALGGGGDVDATFDQLVESVKTFGNNLGPVIEEIVQNILRKVGEIWDDFKENNPAVAAAVGSLAIIITTLLLPALIATGVQSLIAGAKMLIGWMMALGPIGLIIAAITAVVAVVVFLYTQFEWFRDAVDSIISGIAQFFTDAWNNIMGFFEGIITTLQEKFSNFGDFIHGIVDNIVGFFSGIGSTIGGFIEGGIKGVVNGALGLLEGFLNSPINLINGAIDLINNLPGVSIGKIENITLPRWATGGYVSGAGTSTSDSIPALLSNGEYVVNAKAVDLVGHEYLDSINSGRIPAGGGIQVNQTNNNYSQFDLDSANANLYNKLRTAHA